VSRSTRRAELLEAFDKVGKVELLGPREFGGESSVRMLRAGVLGSLLYRSDSLEEGEECADMGVSSASSLDGVS